MSWTPGTIARQRLYEHLFQLICCTATTQSGEIVRGAIHAGDLAGGVKVEIPVVVITGAGPGRIFWINTAIHGD